MLKEDLSIFATIKGISAASGLFLKQHLLYLIGDNSAYLYEFDTRKRALHKIKVLEGLSQLENIPKATKPDFEVLCCHGDDIYLMGSGSTPQRNLMAKYDLRTKSVASQDLTALYQRIKDKFSVAEEDLNIEGAVFNGKEWFLFNRGNGNAAKNGIFKIEGQHLAMASPIAFVPILLLKTNHVLATFTDAVLHQDEIYFMAAAEDTSSTYHDGKILGSYIGGINTGTLALNFTKQVSTYQKFEGITVFSYTATAIEFLLCEDSDTDSSETIIYRFKLSL